MDKRVYIVFNQCDFPFGAWYYVLERKDVIRLVDCFVKGEDKTQIDGRTFDISSELFQVYVVPEYSGITLSGVKNVFNDFITDRFAGNVTEKVFESQCKNVTKEFLAGNGWGAFKTPYLNLFYRNHLKKLYLLYVLESHTIKKFLDAYRSGASIVNINGTDILLGQPSIIKIFEIDASHRRATAAETKQHVKEYARQFMRKGVESRVLEEIGLEVTIDYDIESFGAAGQKVEPVVVSSAKTKDKSKIFVSHSTKDGDLVRRFVNIILDNALGVHSSDVFCTSIEGMGIKSGEDFKLRIKNELLASRMVIQFLSDDYKRSEVCQNEMGAAWVICDTVVPFVCNNEFDKIGFIHGSIQQLDVSKKVDILKFVDDYEDHFPAKSR